MTINRTIHRPKIRRAVCAVLAVALVGMNAMPFTSHAAAKPKYGALLVNQIDQYLVLPPGKGVTAWVEFQNVGTSSWSRTGSRAVTLTTDKPLGHASLFQTGKRSPTWRPTRMVQSSVAPGETARFRFALKAPSKTGIRIERFMLVVDGQTPVSGGDIEFVIAVGSSADPAAIMRAKSTASNISLWVKPGERVLKSLTFLNNGYTTIRNEGYAAATILPATTSGTVTSTQTTPTFSLQSTTPVDRKAVRAKTTTATLDVKAPSEPGVYTQSFALMGRKNFFNGSRFTVQLTVSNDAQPPLTTEPLIRVGVFAPVLTKPVEFTANGAYEIRTATSNELLATRSSNEVASVTYDSEKALYTLTTNKATTTSQALRFVPKDANTIMQIKTTALGSYNSFRGTLEVRYAPATKKLWVINELTTEKYLRGLAETTSKAPDEFVKTLMTAARTYALYKVFQGKSHDNEFYKINSTTDQVYKGYNYEILTPNITAAVEQTRGVALTHPADITERNKIGFIVAAYSSCTDGNTRSFYERWGGGVNDYPYLVSVPDPKGVCTNPPYSNASRMLQGLDGNHMVGLSARGALMTSQELGATYQTVLRYYYSGASVIRAYL